MERKKAAVSVVMLGISDYKLKGFHVVYSDVSSKTVSSTVNDNRIRGWAVQT